MAEMQNALKEVDLQIVYRRLEARKRNITKNGQMSKRQLATAYRGYHGLEAQYHALVQMSGTTMINTKSKNDHLHLKHLEDLKHIVEQEKCAQNQSDREIKTMRDDFTAQLAYQYVYKTHSFKRYFKSQQEKKPRPVSDKPEFYDLERRNTSSALGPRPLGSLRQMELYKDELKLKFPPIAHKDQTGDISPRVNMLGSKSYQEMKAEDKENEPESPTMTSFPNIEDAMGIHVKFRRRPFDDDNASAITAPPARLDAENDELSSAVNPNLTTFDMGHNLMLMRRKEKERYERKRQLPATPSSKPNIFKPSQKVEPQKEVWRRLLPETPKRPQTVFPGGARSPTDLKKIIKKEAESVVDSFANLRKRNEVVQLAKEHHQRTLAENPIPVFDRNRPTSAIIRDFKEYKRIQEEQRAAREEAENDQSIIVRQMSPLPRVGSPIAQTRQDYMRKLASRGGSRRESTPVPGEKPGKLRRTESEKFPSVSRTSSFKEVPDIDLCLENAQLTAAERIELEKQKLNKDSHNVQPQRSEKTIRRRLPSTPRLQHTHADQNGISRQTPKMFNTSILEIDKDVDSINRVLLANATDSDVSTKKDVHGKDKRNEQNSFTPESKHVPDQGKQDSMPFPAESLSKIKAAGGAYGKDFWPKLSKKMQFDYESFSRTTPEMKKRLELRAKNRKKITQKNAQLAEEMKLRAKTAKPSEEADRPSTRVSFNENVIVFQTI